MLVSNDALHYVSRLDSTTLSGSGRPFSRVITLALCMCMYADSPWTFTKGNGIFLSSERTDCVGRLRLMEIDIRVNTHHLCELTFLPYRSIQLFFPSPPSQQSRSIDMIIIPFSLFGSTTINVFFCIKINSNLNKHLNCESGNKIFFNALCAIWWIKHLIDVLSSKVRKIELKAWIKFMAVSLFEILLRVLLSWWSRSLHEKQIWKSKWQTKRNLIGINCDSEIKRDIERNNCGRKVSRFADVFLLPCYKGGLNSRVRDFEDGLSGALTRRFSRWRENVSPIIS